MTELTVKNDKKDVSSQFDRIYLLYFSRLLRFAKEYVETDEDAENIVQDVFMVLWEKREALTINTTLATYLFTLIKYRSLDYLRHKSIQEEHSKELALKQQALEQMNYIYSSEEELEKILSKALTNLPERCRQVFIMSRIEGKKYREIADELNISVNTVENQMVIALKKMRHELKDYLPLLLFLL